MSDMIPTMTADTKATALPYPNSWTWTAALPPPTGKNNLYKYRNITSVLPTGPPSVSTIMLSYPFKAVMIASIMTICMTGPSIGRVT